MQVLDYLTKIFLFFFKIANQYKFSKMATNNPKSSKKIQNILVDNEKKIPFTL